jgi:hypothetical protein
MTGSPQAEAAAGTGTGAATGPRGSLDQAREDALRRLLQRFEAGALSAPEYTERVRMVERSTSLVEMAELSEAATRPEPVLDPVDILLLARPAQQLAGKRRPRYFIVAVLLFFFVVLLVVGIWLAAHARTLHKSGNLGVVAAAEQMAASAPVVAPVPTTGPIAQGVGPASPPLSVRSSRR